MIKDGGSILDAYIKSLPIQRGRIMDPPKNIQQFLVKYKLRIIFHTYHLSVPCLTAANFLICWVFRSSAGIPHLCANYAHYFIKG
jgi:hypothetical protein